MMIRFKDVETRTWRQRRGDKDVETKTWRQRRGVVETKTVGTKTSEIIKRRKASTNKCGNSILRFRVTKPFFENVKTHRQTNLSRRKRRFRAE